MDAASSPPTPDSIKRLVLQLLRPKNLGALRRAVDASVARDVVFWHSLGVFRGRDAYYSALRVATSLWSYERVDFEDVFVSKVEEEREEGKEEEEEGPVVAKAALVLVLSIRPRLFPLSLSPLLDFPTIAVLHFERRPSSQGGNSNKYLLTRHVDSNNVVALATALSPLRVPWRVAARLVWPVFGASGVLAARVLDAASNAREAACAALGSWLRPLLLLAD